MCTLSILKFSMVISEMNSPDPYDLHARPTGTPPDIGAGFNLALNLFARFLALQSSGSTVDSIEAGVQYTTSSPHNIRSLSDNMPVFVGQYRTTVAPTGYGQQRHRWPLYHNIHRIPGHSIHQRKRRLPRSGNAVAKPMHLASGGPGSY